MFGNGNGKPPRPLYRLTRQEREAIAPLLARVAELERELRLAHQAVGHFAVAVATRQGLGECDFNRAELWFEPVAAQPSPLAAVPTQAPPAP